MHTGDNDDVVFSMIARGYIGISNIPVRQLLYTGVLDLGQKTNNGSNRSDILYIILILE